MLSLWLAVTGAAAWTPAARLDPVTWRVDVVHPGQLR